MCRPDDLLNDGCGDGVTTQLCRDRARQRRLVCACADLVNACSSHGQCIDAGSGHTCRCSSGWSGDRCQTNIDECAGHLCSDQGECEDQVNGYKCNCAAGYSGKTCATTKITMAGGPTGGRVAKRTRVLAAARLWWGLTRRLPSVLRPQIVGEREHFWQRVCVLHGDRPRPTMTPADHHVPCMHAARPSMIAHQ